MSCPWKNPKFWENPKDFNVDEKYPCNFEVFAVKVTEGEQWQTTTDTSIFIGPYFQRINSCYSNLFRRDSSIQYVPEKKTWKFCLGESRSSKVLAELDLDLTPENICETLMDAKIIITSFNCVATGATLIISLGPANPDGYSYRDWLTSTDVERVCVTSAGSRNSATHQALQEAMGEYYFFKWPPCSSGVTVFRHDRKPVTQTLRFTESVDGLMAVFDINGKVVVFQTNEQNKQNLGMLNSDQHFAELKWGKKSEHMPVAAASQPVQTRAGLVADPRLAAAEPRPAVADPRLAAAEPRLAAAESESSDGVLACSGGAYSYLSDLSADEQIEEDRADEKRGGGKKRKVRGSSLDREGTDPFASVKPPIKADLYRILSVSDIYTMTKQKARRELERKMGLSQDALFHRRKELNAWIDEYAENENKLSPQASPELP